MKLVQRLRDNIPEPYEPTLCALARLMDSPCDVDDECNGDDEACAYLIFNGLADFIESALLESASKEVAHGN